MIPEDEVAESFRVFRGLLIAAGLGTAVWVIGVWCAVTFW